MSPIFLPIFLPIRNHDIKPFFHLLTETGVASLFLRTLLDNPEEAQSFISKNGTIDLEDLRQAVEGTSCILPPISCNKMGLGPGVRTKTVLLKNRSCILHFHMVQELGAWKIYGVEKE